ncbi:MAG: tyrosine-type recombinase/integrase [Chloroflexota bacterium]|nr:tyrosine-type recombinase/integrase [Chloroflexota bacterium]
MKEDIKSFLDYLAKEKRYSPNTLSAYNSDLSQLASYADSQITNSGLDYNKITLDASLLSGYMRSLKERKYTQSTVARKVAAAKSFLKFMVETGKLRSDLAPNLASPQISKSLPKPLSVSEVRRLLAEPAKLSTIEAKRDRAMLELLYATGLRASELMALNVEDIEFKSGSVRSRGRNTRERVLPLDQHIARLVGDYIDNARPDLLNNEEEVALFLNRRGERLTRQGFWQIVQGYADRVGLDTKVTPRSLRHSFATHKLKGGADLQSVQELLGHAHISTTRAYKQVETHP